MLIEPSAIDHCWPPLRILGEAGIKVFSRVTALLLAAIAVNMVIRGVQLVGILHTPS